MMKKFTAFVCIFIMLIALPALAAKKGTANKQKSQKAQVEDTEPAPEEEYKEDEGFTDTEGGGKPKGRGLVITGWILMGLGGAAAITGSTMATASSKRTEGAIIGGCGAGVSLIGTMLMLFGSGSGGDSYAVGPSADPASGTYGLGMAGSF